MVKDKRVIAAVLVLAAVGGYFFWGKDSPEKQVKNRLGAFCDCVSKEAGEPKSTLIIKNERLSRMFADEIVVSGDANMLAGTHDTSEFLRLVQQGRFMFQSVSLSFSDVTVAVLGTDKATADATVRLNLVGKGGQTQTQNFARQITLTLVKQEDKWVFKEFDVVQIMEK